MCYLCLQELHANQIREPSQNDQNVVDIIGTIMRVIVEAIIQVLIRETVGFHYIHISLTSYKYASYKCDVYNPFNLLLVRCESVHNSIKYIQHVDISAASKRQMWSIQFTS